MDRVLEREEMHATSPLGRLAVGGQGAGCPLSHTVLSSVPRCQRRAPGFMTDVPGARNYSVRLWNRRVNSCV